MKYGIERAILFDGTENYLSDLNTDSLQTEEIFGMDGELHLTGQYPLNEALAWQIEEGCMLALDDPEGNDDEYLLFVIDTLQKTETHLIFEGDHDYMQMAQGELVTFNTNADNSDVAIISALQNELYETGVVEIDRPLKRSRYKKNPLECLRYIEKEWGGELKFRVTITGSYNINRYVDHLQRIGKETGTFLEFGHNIGEFEHIIETDHIRTAMYGYGKGEEIEGEDETQKLTFADVVWNTADGDPVDKPAGQEWVGDENARIKYGRPDGNGGRKHRFGVYESQAETKDGLIHATHNQLEKVVEPLVNVKATMQDLGAVDIDFDHERARIGETYFFVAETQAGEIEAKVRIMKLTRVRHDPTQNEVELGNFLPAESEATERMEREIKTLSDRRKIYDEGATGAVEGSRVQGIIDAVKAEYRNSQAYIYENENGILLLNDDIEANPTKAMLLTGGQFFLANEQDVNGEWNWRTFGDGDGFIADELIAGTIRTDLVEIMGDTHFRWNDQNIYMIDPNNAQRQIRIGKYNGTEYGIGFTNDGGSTWNTQLSFDGLQVGSNTDFEEGYSPSEIKDDVQTEVDQKLTDYVTATTYNQEVEELQNQIDNNITTWFGTVAPTLDNYPAGDWTTEDEKTAHNGDLYYNEETGYGYRYKYDGTNEAWIEVKDSDVQKALSDASKAQDTADSKRRIFVSTPTAPYDVGDAWMNGEIIYRCVNAKASGQTFASSDWDRAGDVTSSHTANDTENVNGNPASDMETQTGAQEKANTAESNAESYADGLKQEIDGDISALDQDVTDLNTYVDGSFRDGVIEEAEAKAIKKHLNELQSRKEEIDARYQSLYNNKYISGDTQTSLATAKSDFNTAHDALITAINDAIEDGKTTTSEADNVDSKFTTYETNISTISDRFETAVDNIAQNKANSAESSANDYSDGLKQELDGDISTIDQDLTDFEDYVDGTFKTDVLNQSEAKAVEKQLNNLENIKKDMDSAYNEIYNDAQLTGNPKTFLYDAKQEFDTDHNALKTEIENAVSDGSTTQAEKDAVDTKFTAFHDSISLLRARLNQANFSISQAKADKAESDARTYTDKETETAKQNAIDHFQKVNKTYSGNWDLTTDTEAEKEETFTFDPMPEALKEYVILRVNHRDFEGGVQIFVNENDLFPRIINDSDYTGWDEIAIDPDFINTESDNVVRFYNDSIDGASLYSVELDFDSKAFTEDYTESKVGSYRLFFDTIEDENGAVVDGTFVALNKAMVNYLDNLTIEAWVNTPKASDNIVISYDRSEFYRFGIGSDGTSGRVTFNTRTDSSTHDFSGQTNVADGNWHHIAGVYEKSTGKKYIYVDGQLDNEITAHTAGESLGRGVTRYGFIGRGSEATAYNNGTGPDSWFEGFMSDVRMWSAVKTQEDIQSNMFNMLNGKEADLWACWNLLDGYGATKAKDQTDKRLVNEIFNGEWKPVDNVMKNYIDKRSDENADLINGVSGDVSDLDDYIDGDFYDQVIEEGNASVLDNQMKQLSQTKKAIDNRYQTIYNNSALSGTQEKTDLNNQKINVNDAYTTLIDYINSAKEDGRVSQSEVDQTQTYFDDFNNKVAGLFTEFENSIDKIAQVKSDNAEQKAKDASVSYRRQVDENDDFDTLIDIGVYRVSVGTATPPNGFPMQEDGSEPAYGWGILTVEGDPSSRLKQTYAPHNFQHDEVEYTRIIWNGEPTNWRASESQKGSNSKVNSLESYVDGAFKDGVIEESEAQAIEKYLNSLETEYENVTKRYQGIYNNSNLDGTINTALQQAKLNYNSAKDDLIISINSAISDGSTTQAEKDNVDSKFSAYKSELADLSTKFEEAMDNISKNKADKAQSGAEGYADTVSQDVLNKSLTKNASMANGAFSTRIVLRAKAVEVTAFEDSTKVFKNNESVGTIDEGEVLSITNTATGDKLTSNKPTAMVYNHPTNSVPSLNMKSKKTAFYTNRYSPHTVRAYSQRNGTLEIRADDPNKETPDYSVSLEAGVVSTLTISDDDSGIDYFLTSDVDFIAEKHAGDQDATTLYPASKEIMVHGQTGTMNFDGLSITTDGFYKYSDGYFQISHIADGAGSDMESGVPWEMCSDHYMVPHDIADYKIATIQPCVVSVYGRLSDGSWELHNTHDCSDASRFNPINYGVGTDSGAGTPFGYEAIRFEADGKFYLRTNDPSNEDEYTPIGIIKSLSDTIMSTVYHTEIMRDQVDSDIGVISGDLSDFEDYVDGDFYGQVTEESEAKTIETLLKNIDSTYEEVQGDYLKVRDNAFLESGSTRNALINAKTDLNNAYDDATNYINSALSDNRITSGEKSTIENKFDTFVTRLTSYASAYYDAVEYIAEKRADKAREDAKTYANQNFERNVHKGTSAPSSPESGDLWLDTGTFPNLWMRYTGSSWTEAITNDLSKLVGKIGKTQVGDNSITTPAIASNEIVTRHLQAEAITVDKLDVLAKNYINNFTNTKTTKAWSVVDDSDLATSANFNDTMLKMTTSGNMQVRTDTFEVQSDQSYKFSVQLNPSDVAPNGGQVYFGIYAYDENGTKISTDIFNVGSREFNGSTDNPYFHYNVEGSNWVKLNGFVMGHTTDEKGMPNGLNVTNNFRMKPETKYLKMRVLNYYNETSTTLYVYNPSVTRTDAGKFSFDNGQGGTLVLGGAGNVNGRLVVKDADGNNIADLDAEEGGFRRLSVGELSANNVAEYNEESYVIRVDPENGDDQATGLGGWNDTGTDDSPLKSVAEAVRRVPKYNNGDILIQTHYNNSTNVNEGLVVVEGIVGSGTVTIDFQTTNNQMSGSMDIFGCTNKIILNEIKFNSTSWQVIHITDSNYELTLVDVYGNDSSSYGVYLDGNSAGVIDQLEVYDVGGTAIHGEENAMAYIRNCSGLADEWGVSADKNCRFGMYGTVPGGGTGTVRERYGGEARGNVSADYGSASTPAPPETTETWTANDAGTYDTSYNSWDSYYGNTPTQGAWDTNIKSGFWFFGSDLSNTVSGKTISEIQVYIERQNEGGYSSKVPHYIRWHNLTSEGSVSDESQSSEYAKVDLKWGEGAWVTLPSSFYADFENGSAKGIGVYYGSSSKSYYSRLKQGAKIKITYA